MRKGLAQGLPVGSGTATASNHEQGQGRRGFRRVTARARVRAPVAAFGGLPDDAGAAASAAASEVPRISAPRASPAPDRPILFGPTTVQPVEVRGDGPRLHVPAAQGTAAAVSHGTDADSMSVLSASQLVRGAQAEQGAGDGAAARRALASPLTVQNVGLLAADTPSGRSPRRRGSSLPRPLPRASSVPSAAAEPAAAASVASSRPAKATAKTWRALLENELLQCARAFGGGGCVPL